MCDIVESHRGLDQERIWILSETYVIPVHHLAHSVCQRRIRTPRKLLETWCVSQLELL